MCVFQVLFIKIVTVQRSEFEVTRNGMGFRDQNTENSNNSKIKFSAFPTLIKTSGNLKFKILRSQDRLRRKYILMFLLPFLQRSGREKIKLPICQKPAIPIPLKAHVYEAFQ